MNKIDRKKLIYKIQDLRKEMQQIARERGIHDKNVIKKSQELDKMLNEYEKLISENE